MNLYGELKSDVRAEQNQQCRQIVSEIMNFGVTQRQIWYLIYLLSNEMESVEDLKMMTDVIKSQKPEIFLSPTIGEEQV